MKKFPKTLCVKIGKGRNSGYLLAAPDINSVSPQQEGEKSIIGVYRLDHLREVTVIAASGTHKKMRQPKEKAGKERDL